MMHRYLITLHFTCLRVALCTKMSFALVIVVLGVFCGAHFTRMLSLTTPATLCSLLSVRSIGSSSTATVSAVTGLLRVKSIQVCAGLGVSMQHHLALADGFLGGLECKFESSCIFCDSLVSLLPACPESSPPSSRRSHSFQ